MKRLISHILICLIVFSAFVAAVLPQRALAAPVISISPRSGAPGTKVTVDGANFASYAGDNLLIFFNDTRVASATAASGGTFSTTFEVPARTAPGYALIGVRGNLGNEIASDVFAVPVPEIRLSTWGGAVTTGITVTCRGFHASKPVTLYYYFDGEMVRLGVQNAGETGECNLRLDVPASPRGKHHIVASNEEGQSASAEFEIIPSVTVEPAIAAMGDKVTITATGFTADSEVEVGLYDQTVAYARSSSRGSFNAQFIVPVVKAGKYELEIKDFSGVVEWGELEITSRLSLSKTAGEVGAKIDVVGTGFEVRWLVTITYDSQPLTFANTDDTGAFTTIITVPVGPGGAHFVTATDGTNTRQVVYSVEKEPPSVPVPLSPRRFASTTLPLTIDWESVYDVSQPLVYTLDIARLPDALRPVLRKSGLTASQYILTDRDALPPNRPGTYYYWRVQATDGAGNIGEWSEPVPFHIEPSDTLPSWTRYIFIALQIAIAGVFGYSIWKGARGAKP